MMPCDWHPPTHRFILEQDEAVAFRLKEREWRKPKKAAKGSRRARRKAAREAPLRSMLGDNVRRRMPAEPEL